VAQRINPKMLILFFFKVVQMNFDVKTILQELKKLKDKPTAELVFDWSIIHAWANKLKQSKETPEL